MKQVMARRPGGVAFAVLALVLGGCGGGGGGSSPTAPPPAFTVGGSISGLNGTGLVLANGADRLNVALGATGFTMPTALAGGSAYAVSVAAQPAGLSCTVASGTGSINAANVSNVVVTCADNAYTLGGPVSGLTSTGLVLTDGTDTLPVLAGATSFTFPTSVAYASSYRVSVQTQPTGETCAVSNASGTMPPNNVTNISVFCSIQAATYTLGGTISGLTVTGLVLTNGADALPVLTGAASFTMPTALAAGSAYSVAVGTQPTGLTCTVSGGSGTMPAANVSSVSVSCATASYTLGGTISGLAVGGLVLANGADTLVVAANATSFSMPAAVAYGNGYAVTVGAQPFGMNCTVFNGSGTMPGNNVTAVQVGCLPLPATETLLWSFAGSPDGSHPVGALVQGSDGNFYGTTQQGGTYSAGTVFRMTPSGAVTILYSFVGTGLTTGGSPAAALVQGSDGDFYGSTAAGLNGNCGSVFKITPSGSLSVLHAWAGNPTDGCQVHGPLIQGSDGNFYGATAAGGTVGAGTVFKMTPTGAVTVLYSFAGGTDGATANGGGLVEGSDGNFYGMTSAGGAGYGTVFRVTPLGAKTVLHTFGGGTDGGRPASGLVQASNGNFYGTSAGVSTGGGTLFQITPTGTMTQVYSFPLGGPNGPVGLLIGPDGNFYGVTSGGGTYNQGTVWKITPSGAETTLYSLQGGATDGSDPLAGLVVGHDGVSQYLYGCTDLAGAHNLGTLFKIVP